MTNIDYDYFLYKLWLHYLYTDCELKIPSYFDFND